MKPASSWRASPAPAPRFAPDRAHGREDPQGGLRKVPGVAETLDWAAALVGLDVRDLHDAPGDRARDADVPVEDPRGQSAVQAAKSPTPAGEGSMSCCGTPPTIEEIDEVSRLVSKSCRLPATLRDNAFAVGLREGQDAAALMLPAMRRKPGLLRSAFKHLFSARKADWEKFDGLFDAFWLGKRVRSRSRSGSAAPQNNPRSRACRKAGQSRRAAAFDQVPGRRGPAATTAAAKAAWKAPRGRKTSPRRISARSPIRRRSRRRMPSPRGWRKAMRTRLTRRDLARRRGYRLDLRRTIHRNISHGGVPISLVRRQRKEKPLRLVMLLDASGSMSMYTAVFLRFIHGVLDEFREAEAFLFHTRLAHVSDAMKERDAARALDRLSMMAQGRRRRHADRREPARPSTAGMPPASSIRAPA